MEVELVPEEPGHKKGRHRKKQLYNSILQQMEFYFSDSNLSKDRFLSQMIQTDPNIEISVFLKFNKLRKLTTNIEDITKAISKSQLIQLSEDKTKVRRKLPIKINNDVDDCTIYVERLKSDATHDWLKSIFSEFGKVVYVSIPKYKHSDMIKGFAFVEFECAEGAKAAMQYFESIDCTIPSDIEPQKLLSIATFNANETNRVENKNNVQEENLNTEMDQDVDDKLENTNEFESDASIKIKRKRCKSEGDLPYHVEIKKMKIVTNEISDEVEMKKIDIKTVVEEPPQKKRKHSESEETIENIKQELGEEKEKLKDISEENKQNIQVEPMSDGEEEKKKKKHKKSNRKKINLKEIGLQILCKKDWKKMRNRYLEMQRKTMKQLKQHLNRQKFSNRYGNKKSHFVEEKIPEVKKVDSQFIPGTIVKVSLSEPCENNKKLKAELKDLPHEIKFVDIPLKIGSEEVYIRFTDNTNAQAFCASNFSKGKLSILQGNEEKNYWEKIEISKQEKQKKCVGKQRGRDKLLKKAERQAAKHVRFDGTDSE